MALVINDLPLEVIVHILLFLPIRDLLQALLACRVFYHAGNIAYSRRHHNQLGLWFLYKFQNTKFFSLQIYRPRHTGIYCISQGGWDRAISKEGNGCCM